MTIQYNAQMLAGGKTVEIQMYDRIGGGFFFEGITAKMISRTLKDAGNPTLIHIRMNSPGGSVFEGNAIRSILQAHPARVEIDIDGLAASAATVIATAADEVRIAQNAMMMIHEASGETVGGARKHRSTLSMLEGINAGVAEVYAARTGMSVNKVLALMDAETWYTAAEAVAVKLADKVTEAKKIEASWDSKLLTEVFQYQHVPAELLARAPYATAGDVRQYLSPHQSGETHGPPTNMSWAPAPTRPRTEKMATNLDRIALALGLNEGAEEAAVVASLDKLRDNRRELQTLVAEVELMTGHKGSEAIGALRAFKAAAETLPVLQTQVTDLQTKLQSQELAELIRRGKDEDKLTPALIGYYEKRPVEELRGFLTVAPRVLNTAELRQPAGAPPTNGGSPDAAMAWEKLTAMQKHNMHHSDPAGYEACKSEYEQRTGHKVGG